MKEITEEKFRELTEAEKCRIIVRILQGELVYKRSDVNEWNH